MFKKVDTTRYQRPEKIKTADEVFWSRYEFPLIKREPSAITSIHVSPSAPHRFLATSSVKCDLFATDKTVIRSIGSSKSAVQCAKFRNDGKLIAVGGDDKVVRLFEPSQRMALRYFSGHTESVHALSFLGQSSIVSGSDDKSLLLWDITTGEKVQTWNDHKDYVRVVNPAYLNPSLFVSGSYDHLLNIFDTRQKKPTLTMNHESAVEDMLFYPTDAVLISVGGLWVKVWDIQAGGRLIAKFSTHHKTITCLCYCNSYQRLVTASIDRRLKVYEMGSYEVVYSVPYSAPITSLAMAPDDSLMLVGLSDGLLSMKSLRPEEKVDRKIMKRKRGDYSRLSSALSTKNAPDQSDVPAQKHVAENLDHVIQRPKMPEYAKYERLLRRFEYSQVLDCVLETTMARKRPEVTVSVLRELLHRQAIHAAIAGRSYHQLKKLFTFMQKNLTTPKFSGTLMDVLNVLLQVYGSESQESPQLTAAFARIKTLVDSEIVYVRCLGEMSGMLETLISSQELTASR